MLQLRRIRSFTKNGQTKEYDSNFEPDILIENHVSLFNTLEEHVKKIPEFERFNCHYTLGESEGGKKRGKGTFLAQEIIPFDVDGIEWAESKAERQSQLKNYCQVFYETTNLDPSKTVVVFSGGGLHFIILTDRWTDKEYFRKHGKVYAGICKLLETNLISAGLKFKELDRAVFAPNHMLRLPGTINKKQGREDRPCKLLVSALAHQPFDWGAFAKETKALTKEKAEKPSQIKGEFPKVDTPAVESGCLFLRHCKENPAKVNESQWYASLSILSRLEDGKAKCHEYSKGHPNYSVEECDAKIENALTAGPRLCENISGLWEGCSGCEYSGKVKTPITIRSQEFIATEHTGFHKVLVSDNGVKYIPQHDDLVKFFEREHTYISNEESGEVYVFDGKKYKYFSKNQLRGFAGKHFSPQPNENHIQEFMHRVNRRNHVEPSFLEANGKYINFQNGILDLDSGRLLEHSPDYGFLYVLPYDYSETARCPEFDKMMARITCNDTQLEQLLLEFTGYALCDRTYEHHKALILIGEGANGKSTFLDIVKALAGAENFSALGIKEMDKDTNRALLEGKLVNISDEMPNMAMQDTDIFKKMMGGSITIRRLYGMPTVHRCTTKLMFAANEIPATYDHSHGLFRRLLIVPFDARFEGKDVDRTLMPKLMRELPGIFNRVLQAFRSLKKAEHFTVAERSVEQLNSYRTDNDAIGSAIRELIVAKPGPWTLEDFTPSEELMLACCPQSRLDRDKVEKRFRKALTREYSDLKKREARKWVVVSGNEKKYLRGYLGLSLIREPAYTNGKDHGAVKGSFPLEHPNPF